MYKEAAIEAQELTATNQNKLILALNYSIFLFDFMKSPILA